MITSINHLNQPNTVPPPAARQPQPPAQTAQSNALPNDTVTLKGTNSDIDHDGDSK